MPPSRPEFPDNPVPGAARPPAKGMVRTIAIQSGPPLPSSISTRPAVLQPDGLPLSQPTVAPVQLTMAPPAQPAPSPARPRTVGFPDVRYFVFDGGSSRGPLSRKEFLECVAGAPDRTGWWYWGEHMPEWRPLDALGEPAPMPYRLARKQRP